jgi:hypothetical protein
MNDLSPIRREAYRVGNFDHGSNVSEVSMQWFRRSPDQRFTSLDDLASSVLRRSGSALEDVVDVKALDFVAPYPKEIADTHRLSLVINGKTKANPNHWSFSQLAALAKAPGAYLRTLPTQIVADALHHGMRAIRENPLVKTYVDTDGTLMAATGPEYGRVLDIDVVRAIQQVAGNGTGDTRWKVPGTLDWSTMRYDPETPITKDTTTLYASDRDLFVFLVDDRNPIEVGKLPNGEPDLMFRGFYVMNSEVGARPLVLAAFYLRGVCMNRNLWGVENFTEISIRHNRLAPSRFVELARPALESFANGSDMKLIDAVNKAKAAKLASDQDEALAFLQSRDFSRKRALEILEIGEREEERPVRTAWDFAQAITAAARSIPNSDDRFTVERVAGRILDAVA